MERFYWLKILLVWNFNHTYTHTHTYIYIYIYIYIYKLCSKSIETEDLNTRTRMNNEWNIYFFKITPLGIKHAYSSEFSIGQSTFENPLLVKTCTVSFLSISSTSSNLLLLKWIFSLGNKKKSHKTRSAWKVLHLHNSVIRQKVLTTVSGWADNRRMVRRCATDFPENLSSGFEFSIFHSPWLVALLSLKSSIDLLSYPYLEGKWKDSLFSQEHLRERETQTASFRVWTQLFIFLRR